MKVLSKYTKVNDAETLARLRQACGTRCGVDRIPYARAEGAEETLRRTPGSEASETQCGRFDNSLLKEGEQSGWLPAL